MHSPHSWNHVSICHSPHGFHDILPMFDIMSPYVILHMVYIACSSCLISCLHMLFSTWFPWHFPHAWNHFSICYSPHSWQCILLMLKIMSPYGILHMVCMACSSCLTSFLHMLDIMSPYAILHMNDSAFSSCLIACLHMLFSTRFAWHSPHG